MTDITIKSFFDLKMPEIDLPDEKDREMLVDALRVKSTSGRDSRLAMLKLAFFFKRECHFDCLQYAPFYALEDDDECHAYIWTVEKVHFKIKSVVIGGFCFRKREWGGYGLQWVWIHPYMRNSGLLTRHWSAMEDKFGKNFFVEPPLSHSMQGFLMNGDNSLHMQDPESKEPPKWFKRGKGIPMKTCFGENS